MEGKVNYIKLYPVCPHCGYADMYWWEGFDAVLGVPNMVDIECPSCHGEFGMQILIAEYWSRTGDESEDE